MSIKLLTTITTYLLIIFCELGDKTQVAVLLLTSRSPTKRWLIFLAGALALSLCVLVEISVGIKLAQYISAHLINKFAGGVFVLMGTLGLWKEINAHFLKQKDNVFMYEEAERSR
ncbi:MAG: hypothetical protein H6Q64_1016 [Firmicutes bacterium]|nr:hypothetical protein [Bacillota bacterium]